ncbi:hypothetical protein D1B33_04620 [Lysinibacillus yapensis]|uniref:Uncharacterized protein n=1 Tax=Ureibacillus yapensis TaxID=2304605 RepID=A0A396SEH4_9BACL|nr:hypothetical protein [Lysinibacillus yapensis]RHW40133.1 hypothetical protein D1B33_04620 [Lysinibacillus yapensis]
MVKKTSAGELILSILVALSFVINSFNYTDFTFEGEFALPRLLFYLVMIVSVFNAGLIVQKYIHSKNEKSNEE